MGSGSLKDQSQFLELGSYFGITGNIYLREGSKSLVRKENLRSKLEKHCEIRSKRHLLAKNRLRSWVDIGLGCRILDFHDLGLDQRWVLFFGCCLLKAVHISEVTDKACRMEEIDLKSSKNELNGKSLNN